MIQWFIKDYYALSHVHRLITNNLRKMIWMVSSCCVDISLLWTLRVPYLSLGLTPS